MNFQPLRVKGLGRASQRHPAAKIARISLAISLVAGGAAFGWMLRGWLPGGGVDDGITVNRPITVINETGRTSNTYPNVIGLSTESARQALADAGVDPARVRTQPRPYVGPQGSVVDQRPAAATRISRRVDVILEVARPPVMPALTGQARTRALDQLAALGAAVTTQYRYQAGARDDTVIATQPGAGLPLTGNVTLTVAEPSSSVFLGDLEPVESDCSEEEAHVAGRRHKQSLLCSLGSDPSAIDYVLNKRIETFQGIVGLDDASDTGARVRFRVLRDGHLALERTVGFGQSAAISVGIGGSVRVRLEAELVGAAGSSANAKAAWVDARLVGSRSAVDSLTASASP